MKKGLVRLQYDPEVAMNHESIRAFCLKLPHVTEELLWESNLVFKIGGKMFAILSLDDGATRVAFKCSPDSFAELVEREAIVPAPYLARAHWVSLQEFSALPSGELKTCLQAAYTAVLERLPQRIKATLSEIGPK